MSKPIAYSCIRFSSPAQAEGDSLRRQTETAANYCRRRGWTLSQESYRDLGVSAFRGDNALVGNLGQFLRAVQSGAVKPGSILIVESIDRISRQGIDEGYDVIKKMLKAGIVLVTLAPEREFDVSATKSLSKGALEIQLILERAAEESERKSERVGAAWKQKRAKARAGKEVLTRRLPAWVEMRGERLQLIPGAAAAVQRIFQLAASGYGANRIIIQLEKEKVRAFGRSKQWRRVYVYNLLNDRRVLGELQPHRRTSEGRKPEGEPVQDYYPRIVDESEWLAARASMENRRIETKTRQGKYINLFVAGMLRNARNGGQYWITTACNDGKVRRVLSAKDANAGKSPKYTFPNEAFERGLLSRLAEIDPAEILPSDNKPDEGAVIAAERANVVAKIAELESALLDGEVAAIARTLRALEEKKRNLDVKLAEIRQAKVNPLDESWAEGQELFDTLRSADDPDDARLRLRSILRRIIDQVWILVVPRRRDRLIALQVYFVGGGRRDYLILNRPPMTSAFGGSRPGHIFAKAADWNENSKNEGAYLDLQNPEHVSRLENVLNVLNLDETFPPETELE